MKKILTIPFLLLIIACGSKKEEPGATAAKDSLIVPDVQQVAGIGRIEPEAGLIELSSDQAGLIKKILFKEGDTVKTGQVLLLLDNSVQVSQVADAGSRLQTEKAQLDVAKANMDDAAVNLRKAEQDLEKTRRLVERNAETKQKMEDAEADVKNKQIALETQKANFRVAEKRIAEIQTQINTAKTTASRYSVSAPTNGLILELISRPGEAITAGQAFAQLAPAGRITALCEIDELFADKIRNGQTAFVRYKGYADTVSSGTVIYTAPYLKKKSLFSDQVGEKEDRRVREVRILLNKQDLLINRQVECVINLK
ncbi:MAG TPA: efflux RND transporter periplasmic adaptor subunit [Chitinophagaceae bacterium]|nr:efflux RND transporter periplasmic adaptor subunit [Chitinophagaceae bacterium]